MGSNQGPFFVLASAMRPRRAFDVSSQLETQSLRNHCWTFYTEREMGGGENLPLLFLPLDFLFNCCVTFLLFV